MVVRAGSNARLKRVSRGDTAQRLAAPAPAPDEALHPAAPSAEPEPRGFFARRRTKAPPPEQPVPGHYSTSPAAAHHPRAEDSLAYAAPAFATPAYSAPVSPPPQMPEDAGSVGIAELGGILVRRSRLILGTTALVTLLGAAAAFLISPRYTASSALFIDPRGRASFQTENLPPVGTYDPNLVDSLTFVMESETVLRRVVAAEGLAKDAEFAGTTGDPNVNAVAVLKEAVKVKRPERTYVVEIQVRTKDAAKSARLANAIARAYISDGSDNKSDTVSREQGWVEKQLAALEKRLREAEGRVDEYKTRNRIHGAEGRLVGEQQLADTNRALSDAQRKVAEAKSTLDQVENLRRAGRLPDATNEALKSGVIERLRTQQAEILRLEANSRSTLGPRHPASIEVREQLTEIQRQINEELGRIAENARSAYSVARSNVQGLERELERLKQAQSADSHTLLGLRELERAVDAQKAVYEKFLRDKEAISRLGIETPAGRIIQSAEVPSRASFPNKPLFIVLGFVAGLLLGVGLALLLETLSRGRGARNTLGAPGAAGPGFAARRSLIAPALPAPKRGILGFGGKTNALGSVIAEPEGRFAKAAEGVAAQLWPRPDTLPRSLLISGLAARSSHPEFVLALGLALARRGQSVLMVDGHGGAGSLSEGLAARAVATEVLLGGRRQAAWQLGQGLPGALYLMPFSTQPAPAARGGAQAARVDITLIDGPALRDAAFGGLDVGGSIEGVLALVPKKDARPGSAVSTEVSDRLGNALIGLVPLEG